MNDYKMLAFRYLKMNRRRSRITILGVTVSVMVLFILLNLGCSYFYQERDAQREKTDYEAILFTEGEEQIEAILAEDVIKNAYVGKYYDTNEETTYRNALFVNFENPYRIEASLDRLCDTYNLKGEINDDMAEFYLQGRGGDVQIIYICIMLLISFIFAIFGVGIIRNSIQLSSLEQIKDYGILRCIGATKGQLSSFIYLMGGVLEGTGMVLGILLGYISSKIIGHFIYVKSEMHVLPIFFIAIAFLGDLYFVMQENCKTVNRMTPVSAVRGEFRIKKEKIKARGKGIFGWLLGVEGEYAYKNIRRNPGRFFKTVGAVAIGVGGFIAIAGLNASIEENLKEIEERYGYYPVYFYNPLYPASTKDDIQSSLPSMEILEELAGLDEVESAKRMYSSKVYVSSGETILEKLTKEYIEETVDGSIYKRLAEVVENEEKQIIREARQAAINVYGYEEEDFKRYEPYLIDGTLELSENGLLLVNGGSKTKMEWDSLAAYEYMDCTYTNFKVGDTVEIVDMKKLRELATEKRKALEEENQEEISETKLTAQCWEELVEQGAYQTYVIEGIVSKDVNLCTMEIEPTFVLPMEQYYKVTATDESMVNGIQFHLSKDKLSNKFWNLAYGAATEETYWVSPYLEEVAQLETFRKVLFYVGLGVLFIAVMSGLNIINTTASNLHLRRKEFAQLRVIGISKKRLMYMVMLEGIITTVIADLIGIILGTAIGYGCFRILGIILGMKYHFSWSICLLSIVASLLLLCGSIYVPMKQLGQSMAADLSANGD